LPGPVRRLCASDLAAGNSEWVTDVHSETAGTCFCSSLPGGQAGETAWLARHAHAMVLRTFDRGGGPGATLSPSLLRNLTGSQRAPRHDRSIPMRDCECLMCMPGGSILVPSQVCPALSASRDPLIRMRLSMMAAIPVLVSPRIPGLKNSDSCRPAREDADEHLRGRPPGSRCGAFSSAVSVSQ